MKRLWIYIVLILVAPCTTLAQVPEITVTIGWDRYVPETRADSLVTHFELYEMISSIVSTQLIMDKIPVSDTSCSFFKPADGNTYKFALKSVNPYRKSDYSNLADVTMPDSSKPNAPRNVYGYIPGLPIIETNKIRIECRLKENSFFDMMCSTDSEIPVIKTRIALTGSKRVFDYIYGANINPQIEINNDGKISSYIDISDNYLKDQPLNFSGDIDKGDDADASADVTIWLDNGSVLNGKLIKESEGLFGCTIEF